MGAGCTRMRPVRTRPGRIGRQSTTANQHLLRRLSAENGAHEKPAGSLRTQPVSPLARLSASATRICALGFIASESCLAYGFVICCQQGSKCHDVICGLPRAGPGPRRGGKYYGCLTKLQTLYGRIRRRLDDPAVGRGALGVRYTADGPASWPRVYGSNQPRPDGDAARNVPPPPQHPPMSAQPPPAPRAPRRRPAARTPR